MPMLDAYIPAGALEPESEAQLCSDLTDILIKGEGADPRNPAVRALAWVTVFRPETVYVAGEPAQAPRYRFTAAVPEGQWDARRRARMIAKVTDAVLEAEGGRYDRDPSRVWVLTPEIPDGTWGGDGRVWTLADIVGVALGDAEAGRQYAEAVLAKRRGVATATA